MMFRVQSFETRQDIYRRHGFREYGVGFGLTPRSKPGRGWQEFKEEMKDVRSKRDENRRPGLVVVVAD